MFVLFVLHCFDLLCFDLFCFDLFWFVLHSIVLVSVLFLLACLFVGWIFVRGSIKLSFLGMITLYVLWTIYTNSETMSYVHIIYHILSVICITALGFSPLQHFFIITYIYCVMQGKRR